MVYLRAALSVTLWMFSAALVESAITSTNPRIAIAVLSPSSTLGITAPRASGVITFTEFLNGSIYVLGSINGLKPGRYGFHIHELGDVRTCDTTGPHFDPHGRAHGGRYHDVRHVGDFGNVVFEGVAGVQGVANVDFVDSHISFSGQNNILGRSLVLHEHEDDLGEGEHELSTVTGNAGPRIACGVIGIQAGGWNAATSTYSSAMLLTSGLIFLFY